MVEENKNPKQGTIKKGDFIEIEFAARIKDGGVFDTNIKAEAEKAELPIKEVKPFILSVGNNMILKGLDEDLEGKEVGKKYTVEIRPDKAFGKRNPQLVKMIPLKAFTEQEIVPQRGMQLSLDGNVVKIMSVSGGRVLVDFNNPLAGREVVYDFKINRKVTDEKEKINSLQEFFFRKNFEFTINKEKKEISFTVPKGFDNFIKLFEKQFQDILGMKVSATVESEKKGDKKKSESGKTEQETGQDKEKPQEN